MHNIKFRLYLLIFLTTLPFILYTSYSHYHAIQEQKTRQLDNLSQIALLTASEHKQIQEGARQLLIALSTTPRIISGNSVTCSAFLTELKTNYVRYINFGVADIDGKIICAADLSQALANPPQPSLISQTLSDQTFSVGSYYPINPSGAVINFTYPISRTKIVYASLSLDWVGDYINSLSDAPANLVINILDQNGTVLARRPKTDSAIGQNFASDPLVRDILEIGKGRSTKLGIDNVIRLYAFTALDENHSTFIAVGIPQSEIYSSVKQSLVNSIIIILIISVTSFAIAELISRSLIVKEIDSLRAIDRLKDEFVSLASHQLRSPLTAVRWLTESLLESKKIPPKEQESISKIHITSLRLIELTSTLLSISRLEAGTIKPRPTLVMVTTLISTVCSELTPLLKPNLLSLKLSVPPKLKIQTDPKLVSEILHILLSNAIKYSDPKTTITITVKKSHENLKVILTNYGIGIPDSANKFIFTRFYRSDNARTHSPDGSGLGLYLAKLIAQKIQAELSFTSHKSQTEFSLTLPNKV